MESINDDPPVDLEQLRDISDDDSELMNEFVSIYIRQTREALESLEKDIAARDFESVRQTAHKAVGGGSTCGMNLALPYFRELERLGKIRDLTNAETNLAHAKEAFEQIQNYLKENIELES